MVDEATYRKQLSQVQSLLKKKKDQKQSQLVDRGNFFTNSLSTAGGILGGVGGGILGTIAAPGAGSIAGAAGGGAVGSGAGKWLENLLEGNDPGEGVLGEAALGAIPVAGKGIKLLRGGSKAFKGGAEEILSKPSMMSRMGQKLEGSGNRMLASQSGLTAAQARQAGISPIEVFGNINRRTGLKNLDDMSEVSRSLTGGPDSILDTATRAAVSSTPGVNLGNLRRSGEILLDDFGSLVSNKRRDKILGEATRAATSARGGAKGSLTGLAEPQKAIDAANAFRGTARELTNSFTSTPAQRQEAKIYNSLAKEIEETVYKSPGVNESIPMLKKAVADDILFNAQDLRAAGKVSQAKAQEKIAKEVMGINSVAELRSMKKDFVDLGKIDRATAQAQGARSLTGSDMTNKAGNIIRNPMNIVATPLDAATPSIAGAITGIGRKLQGRSGAGGAGIPPGAGGLPAGVPGAVQQNSLGSVKRQIMRSGMVLGGGNALMGQYEGGVDPAEQAAVDNLPSAEDIINYFTQTGQVPDEQSMSPLGMPGGILGGQEDSQTYSRESAAKDIQDDLQKTGGKNMDKYMALYEFLNPEVKEPKQKQATVKEYSQAQSGLSGIDQIAQMLSGDPGLLTRATTPGQNLPIVGGLVSNAVGTGEYNALSNNVLNSLARLNTGAAMPASEEAFYRRLLPIAGDSEETKQQKLAQLKMAFQPFTAGYE